MLGPDDRVELIEGEILLMSPDKSRHAATVEIVADVLRRAFGARSSVRVQHPIALGARSEPEPDVAVVVGSPRDYVDAHPATALLVVEVADTSLAFDRTAKAAMYAAAGLPDYWIVNLVDRCVEVHREPSAAGYVMITAHAGDETLIALGAPTASIRVSELLP